MNDQAEAPKIEFPCEDYLVKILGVQGEPFRQFALDTVESLASGFDRSKVKFRPSTKGTFESITVFITATGEQQLFELNRALRKSELVKVVF